MKNKKRLIIYLVAALVLVTAGGIFAASNLKVFLDKREISVRSINRGGEIYLSLSDLSKAFPKRIEYNPSKNRLDVYSDRYQDVELPEGQKAPAGNVRAQVMVTDVKGFEFPLKNVKVAAYASNPDVPEEEALSAFSDAVSGKNSLYYETHGRVREGKTDDSGYFFFSLPNGDYEITGIYYMAGGKRGRFWRKKLNVKGKEPVEIMFGSDNAYEIEAD